MSITAGLQNFIYLKIICVERPLFVWYNVPVKMNLKTGVVKMKKLLSLLLVICMCLCMGACGSKDTNSDDKTPQKNAGQDVTNPSGEKEKDADAKGTDGSTEEPVNIEELPADEHTTSFFKKLPEEMYFSSGVGGWATVLTINPNGTFKGEFHDSEMGVTGDKFPNGTYYRCSFTGQFSTPIPLDQYTYISTVENLTIQTPVGEITYEDGVKYENSTPYGLENAKEVVFYLPGAPANTLSDSFLSWVTPHYTVGDSLPEGVYGMYSFNDEAGFVGKK